MASRKPNARSQPQAGRGAKPVTSARGRTAATSKAAAAGRRPASSSRGGAATATRQAPAKVAGNGATSAQAGAATAAPARSGPASPVLRWLLWPLRPFLAMTPFQLSVFLLTLVGLGVSIYLTIDHFFPATVRLLCSDNGLVNCAKVTTSSQSMVFGVIPVALLGLLYYVVMTFLNSPWVWRWQASPPRWVQALAGRTRFSSADAMIRWTRLGWVVAGMGMVIYLLYAELIQIGNICLWCTSVHVVTFLLFCLIVFNATFYWNRLDPAR